MGKHARREGYWRYYELAKTTEASHLTKTLIDIITENPRPGHKKSKRGRPPVHSKQKLDFACLLMMADNNTYRGIESDIVGSYSGQVLRLNVTSHNLSYTDAALVLNQDAFISTVDENNVYNSEAILPVIHVP